jgi:hypothetical protein
MSKTVTLQISDSSSITFDIFYEIRWTDIPPDSGKNPPYICANVELVRSSLQEGWYHRTDKFSLVSQQSCGKKLIRCRTHDALEDQVMQEVRRLLRQTSNETDPYREPAQGTKLRKLIHAIIGLYTEEFDFQMDQLRVDPVS